MGRSPCCDKLGLKKGPWTHEEDQKLVTYIQEHGHGSWRGLPAKAGLQRCGKSCRLRWINYLRPDIKRGKFSLQEEQTIIQLHALLGNRWSTIATHLPKRTDNEIKNHWNTHLKKRLTKMGIDPITHKSKNHTLGSSLSHMAQWENARLEAEARLRCHSSPYHSQLLYTANPPPLAAAPAPPHAPAPPPHAPAPPCLDILKVWQGKCFFNSIESLESPTTILNFPAENIFTTPLGFSEDFLAAYEIGTETEHAQSNWTCIGNLNDISCPIDSTCTATLQASWRDSQIFGLT